MVEGRARAGRSARLRVRGARLSASSATLDVDAQRRIQDDLFARAYFDASTGLPNRELCDRAIADLIAARADRAAVRRRRRRDRQVRRDRRLPWRGGGRGAGGADRRAAGARGDARGSGRARGLDEFCLVIAAPGAPPTTLATCRRLVGAGERAVPGRRRRDLRQRQRRRLFLAGGRRERRRACGARPRRRRARRGGSAAARGCSRPRSSCASASAGAPGQRAAAGDPRPPHRLRVPAQDRLSRRRGRFAGGADALARRGRALVGAGQFPRSRARGRG